MHDCICLIEQNRDTIHEMDVRRNDMLQYYKSLIEEKLNMTIMQKKMAYINTLKLKDVHCNIYYTLQPKHTKEKTQPYIDPDVLITEYTKNLNKFSKHSVFFRIQARIRASRSKKILYNCEDDADDGYDFDNEDDVDDGYEHDIDGENGLFDGGADDYSDNGGLNDENENDVHDDDVHDNEEENDNEIDDNEVDDVEVVKKSKKDIANDLNYYKRLLFSKGYNFDDDKQCFLVRQEYIV
jgi:hypothetical protein